MTLRKPWLWLPPKVAHDLSPFFLQARAWVAEPVTYKWMPMEWRGLRFSNRLGIAGGVDKNGSSIQAWWTLGPGFVEVGTVTPLPQGPNPGRIIARDPARSALWNKMGFPSAGMERVA
ncbi:MAG: quinone-dependent dihydroorotate dehydrogenase, partial [Bdellovibrionaceae bacterium]|nr:quinone-dependent dihydroorotate dehydrogenase [Pseudobdellovibrionaceae bacterium]